MKPKKKKSGAYRTRRYGILNPYGDVWTPDTFNTIAAAQKHIAMFWASQPTKDLSKFTVTLVRVTVSAVT